MAALTPGTIKDRIYELFDKLDSVEQAKCCEGISVLQKQAERRAKEQRVGFRQVESTQRMLPPATPFDEPPAVDGDVIDAEFKDQEDPA